MRNSGSDTKVLTEGKDKQKPRDPPVRVEYVVMQAQNGFRVVDIVTESSTFSKNWYEEFRKQMNDPAKGHSSIVQKLREKIAKQD